MTLNVSKNSNPPLAEVREWSMDKLSRKLEEKILPKSLKWMADGQKTARRFDVALIAYEGGQHLVGMQGAENDEKLTRLFVTANGSPKMGEIYDHYLEQWMRISSDGLFCLWLSTEVWSKWGSWGLAQYFDEKPHNSPKLQSVLNRTRSGDGS